MLEVAQLSVRYGKHVALDAVALDVKPGEIVVMLGANGAGKSSLLKALGGIVASQPGASIRLDGADLARLRAHEIVEAGLTLVPEGRGLFGDLTVRENLQLGAYVRRGRAREQQSLERVLELFPRLAERLVQPVRTMSGGEQQMVALGRALMSAPQILLLDEPSLGLSPLVCRELFASLARVRATGVGVLLVEQNARLSLAIGDRGYLLENGRVVGCGTARQLMDDPAVRRAYLGGAAAPITEPVRQNKGVVAMQDIDLLIDNRDVKAAGGATFERRNPMTGDVASRAAAASVADARAAADAAAKAFPAWSATGPGERRALLLKAADLLQARTPQFIEMLASETGATPEWVGFNCFLASNMLREAAAITTQIAGEVIPSDIPGSLAMAVRQPAGVVLGIAPWNAPVILGVRAIATPLACGNTVVLKASELCPGTHRLIGATLREAGFPDGVVNVVTNAPADAGAVVNALIAHPAVRRINFTGSTRVGKLIALKAAEHLKPVLLELGGKAPLVVLDDADLDAAVDAAAFGAFMNQGQICMSTERIVVDDKVADEFVRRFAVKAASLPAGDPRAPEVVLGSVVDRGTVERVRAMVEDAVGKGAKLVAGGQVKGTVMDAHVLDRVTPAMRIYHEESFGPIVTVVRVNGVEEAVRVANDTEYGLSAAVFGRDVNRALNVARRIQSGICHVNGPTVHDEAQMPFGGVKNSGYGRFGGKAGIDAFTELRWITLQTEPRHYPF
jgi:acyl-CoA reductase-like NAD-dependent aldehyde dehydrogenase/ABC-type branched-subunit amino acid transport system ATPase component